MNTTELLKSPALPWGGWWLAKQRVKTGPTLADGQKHDFKWKLISPCVCWNKQRFANKFGKSLYKQKKSATPKISKNNNDS